MKIKFEYVLGAVILAAFGFLGGVSFVKWNVVSEKFYEFSATDVIGLIIAVFIGLFTANWITRYVNYDAKRRELTIKALEKLDGIISSTQASFNEYVKTPTVPKSKYIVSQIGKATKQVALIKQIQAETSFLEEAEVLKLENYVLVYKGYATDSPIGSVAVPITEDRQNSASTSSGEVILHINHLMLKLYS